MEDVDADALTRGRGAHARALSACLDQSSAWARGLAEISRRDEGGDISRGGAPLRTGFSSAMRARERSISGGDSEAFGLECVAEEGCSPRGTEEDAPLPLTEEEKRERRMQANRLSAAKSRMKKMRRVVELEDLCETKLARVNELTSVVASLRERLGELQLRNQRLHVLKNTSLCVPKTTIPLSASMEMLQSIVDVNEPPSEMFVDDKDAFISDSDFARQTSLDSVFDSDIFLASPSPKSPI